MYDRHIGYANVPLCCFFSAWERANAHVHQCARAAVSVCDRCHGAHKCDNVRRDKRSPS